MWLPKKRINSTTDSKVTLKDVTENNLWPEMFKLRSEIEKDFGDFSDQDIEIMLRDIKQYISTNCGKWFLCYDGNEIVGEIGYLPIEHDGNTFWRLQDVDILPMFRKKKFGNELLNSICLLAKSRNVDGICLRADENDWKKDWYLRYGFDHLCSF